jgi:hypothetical protein
MMGFSRSTEVKWKMKRVAATANAPRESSRSHYFPSLPPHRRFGLVSMMWALIHRRFGFCPAYRFLADVCSKRILPEIPEVICFITCAVTGILRGRMCPNDVSGEEMTIKQSTIVKYAPPRHTQNAPRTPHDWVYRIESGMTTAESSSRTIER